MPRKTTLIRTIQCPTCHAQPTMTEDICKDTIRPATIYSQDVIEFLEIRGQFTVQLKLKCKCGQVFTQLFSNYYPRRDHGKVATK